jgi:hypothetical protein
MRRVMLHSIANCNRSIATNQARASKQQRKQMRGTMQMKLVIPGNQKVAKKVPRGIVPAPTQSKQVSLHRTMTDKQPATHIA